MTRMVLVVGKRVKLEIRRLRRKTRDAGLAMRCQIILHAAKDRSSRMIAEAVGCSRSWVSRVIDRFRAEGLTGFMDRREDNGIFKLDEWYLGQLYELVGARPSNFGYPRPTWTRELLVELMVQLTGVRVHVATMSRALRAIGRAAVAHVRWCVAPGRNPQEKGVCVPFGDWRIIPAHAKVVVYVDEVDVHLNPKIGLDWMNRGQQKKVVTPGQNEKRYLAGALHAASRRLTCVEANRKNSSLFVALLAVLVKDYPGARKIHVILDNYRIHKSRMVEIALRHFAKRVKLHFLPPYCPNDNKIERVWLDLHAEVTRNHQRTSMDELMADVWRFIRSRNRGNRTKTRRIAA